MQNAVSQNCLSTVKDNNVRFIGFNLKIIATNNYWCRIIRVIKLMEELR